MTENIIKENIDKAIEVLKNGGVILYPTDTVWGLGCDATNKEAVAKIFAIKRREDSKSLITLAADMDMIARYVKEFPEIAISLIEVNDKPMTIIYPGAIGLAENVIAGDGSAGIRIPMDDFCKKLIAKFRRPILSTSANMSGSKSPVTYKEIEPCIKEAVDFAVDPACESREATHKPSQIIKVGLDSEVEIIRG